MKNAMYEPGTLEELAERFGVFEIVADSKNRYARLQPNEYEANLNYHEPPGYGGSWTLSVKLTPEYAARAGVKAGGVHIKGKYDDGDFFLVFDTGSYHTDRDFMGMLELRGFHGGATTMIGDGRGSVHLTGNGSGYALKSGAGLGNAIRSGTGPGDAHRIGQGDGDAIRDGGGSGAARRTENGNGSAIRRGSGNGNAYREGGGDGDAKRIGSGKGRAIRDGSGTGQAFDSRTAEKDSIERYTWYVRKGAAVSAGTPKPPAHKAMVSAPPPRKKAKPKPARKGALDKYEQRMDRLG